jgi:hypothetical protein
MSSFEENLIGDFESINSMNSDFIFELTQAILKFIQDPTNYDFQSALNALAFNNEK